MTALEHTQEMRNIKMWLHVGAISYEQARRMAKPHIEAMNDKAKEIAHRLGCKPRLINFASFMR